MKLIDPSKEFYQSYLEASREYQLHQVTTYAFLDTMHPDVFTWIEHCRTGEGLPEGYVKSTYLWLVDDNEFLGEISIRHSLNDSLLRIGGNIGYGVRWSKWNQGLGSVMLSLALSYARDNLGLSRVLLTCNDDNLGSARVIEKNGGILQDKIKNTVDGKDRITRRYWISL